MKRPVLGTISILAILAVGLYLGYVYRDRLPESNRNSAGPAARAAIQSSLDLLLPATAGDIRCYEEDVERAKLLFARFDVPTAELPALLDQRPIFPAYAELKPDPELHRAMAAQADPLKRPWWDVEHLKELTAAQKSGRRNAAPAVLKWRAQVAATPLGPSVTRVYIAFSEEPAAGN